MDRCTFPLPHLHAHEVCVCVCVCVCTNLRLGALRNQQVLMAVREGERGACGRLDVVHSWQGGLGDGHWLQGVWGGVGWGAGGVEVEWGGWRWV